MREVLFSALLSVGFICSRWGTGTYCPRIHRMVRCLVDGGQSDGQASRPVARQFHHERVSPQSRKVVGRQSLRRAAFRFEECG